MSPCVAQLDRAVDRQSKDHLRVEIVCVYPNCKNKLIVGNYSKL